MYALNDDERVFETYHPESRNKNAPIMMFRISNNHFNPIPQNKQKSILTITSLDASSNLILVIPKMENKDIDKNIDTTVILENTSSVVELGKLMNETKIIPTN